MAIPETLLPSRYWSKVPSFPESARTTAFSPLHNIREVAPESKCECPLEVPHARFDREPGWATFQAGARVSASLERENTSAMNSKRSIIWKPYKCKRN